MHTKDYVIERTGLLLVDPYNDFLSPTGKLWPRAKEVAEEVNLLSNLKSIVDAARQSGVRVFVVPHHRWEPGDYIHWKHVTPRQLAGAKNQVFAKGTWGGEWHPDFVPQQGDVIIKEHWAQSGFANTDLDQQLEQHGIEKIILIGMLANTCIESTGRFGMELGYHVTLVKDATAAESWEEMHAAELNGTGAKHAKRRVGRGIGSGLGKTAGRGHKGQKARAGGYHKTGFEGGQMPLQRRLPKRGFISQTRGDTAEVRLSDLNGLTADTVDILVLKEAGVVPIHALTAKVIVSGEIKRKVALHGLLTSKGAKAAVEAAGGSVEMPVTTGEAAA